MKGAPALVLAERAYGALVRRLFVGLEAEDAEEMIAAFRDLCRAIHRERGIVPALAEAARAILLAVGCALQEWRQGPANRGALQTRQRGIARACDDLAIDLRQGLRLLRRHPALSATVVVTLGAALAVNAAAFAVANAVLFERLPYDQPERVVFLDHQYADAQAAGSVPNLVDFRRHTVAFEQVAASAPAFFDLTGATVPGLGPAGAAEPERIRGLFVTVNFFETLGVRVARGRSFIPAEEHPGAGLVAVVSHALWRGRFAGHPGLLGATVDLNGRGHQVVGIMPEGFRRGRGWGREALADIWAPLSLGPERRAEGQRGNEFLDVYARLRSGVSLQRAQADMDAIVYAHRERFPERYGEASGWHVNLVALHEEIAAPLRPLLMALLAAVAALLLIAASNVSGLLLARAAGRRRETSIRTALGASRGRLVRQLLAESGVLAAAATVLGLLLARASVALLERVDRVTLPRAQTIELDLEVVLATLVVAVAVTVVCGLTPAWHATARQLMQALRARGGEGRARQRARGGLVVVQTALALSLLVGTGLLVRSLLRLGDVDPGFRFDDRLSFQVLLPRERYPERSMRHAFVSDLVARLEALPGVRRAAVVSALPLSGSHNADRSFEIEGRESRRDEPAPHAESWSASSGYFATLGIPLLRGRVFDGRDVGDSRQVVVVSRGLADKYWSGEDPVGRRISFTDTSAQAVWTEVVGVVGDVRESALDTEPRPQLYAPYAQRPYSHFYTVVHAERAPRELVPAVRAAVRGIDAQRPIHDVTSLERFRLDSLAERRAAAATLAAFAVAAVLLAALGLYGVLAYSVRERAGEIGVRMALGARPSQLVGLFVIDGLRLTLPGAALGSGLALVGARLIEGLVFGVTLTDPLTYATVTAALIAVGLAACAIPAWRATRVDPLQALRAD